MFADDPIMGPLLAQESATGAFRTELLSVVRTAFGDGDLPISEVFQRVRDHKMTRSQKRKLYDALADLAMAKQEQWLLDNKDSLLEIEVGPHPPAGPICGPCPICGPPSTTLSLKACDQPPHGCRVCSCCYAHVISRVSPGMLCRKLSIFLCSKRPTFACLPCSPFPCSSQSGLCSSLW